MEHRHTGPADKTQVTATPHRSASSRLDKHNGTIGKLTRKQISDCIHIWAMVYRLHDTNTNTPQLCLLPDSCFQPRNSNRN